MLSRTRVHTMLQHTYERKPRENTTFMVSAARTTCRIYFRAPCHVVICLPARPLPAVTGDPVWLRYVKKIYIYICAHK